MSERLVTVAWIENDVDPEVGFIGVIAHDREIEGSYAVVRRSCAESLLAERDAEIERLQSYREDMYSAGAYAVELRTKFDRQAEQLAALAEQCKKMRTALETAQMALIGYTHQNDITRNAMVKICAAIAKARVGA